MILDPDTGETRDHIRLSSMAAGPPVILERTLVVALRNGTVVGLGVGLPGRGLDVSPGISPDHTALPRRGSIAPGRAAG